MHGRVKTRTSAEENERKKKERAKKVALYKAGIQRVFEKRRKGELDEEGLQLSGQLLSANPDIYTLWNFRKEILLHLKNSVDEEKLKSVIGTELYLTEVCLKNNPKSYGTWHHRCWVLDKMPSINWKKEVAVCNKYLDLDERNFHVWDYRRFVVKKAEVEPKAELEYTTEKINTNFSNYSAWHYRSKLLPVVHPDPHSVRPTEEIIHKKELGMVESAAFTDPYDQSAWFYLRWLLGRTKPDLSICQAIADKHVICLSFNQNVSLNSVIIEGLGITNWKTANGKLFSHVFVGEFDEKNADIDSGLKITVKCIERSTVLDCIELEKKANGLAEYKKVMPFETEFSPGLTAVLEQQLNSCTQLLEFEPDSKWALLTSVYLMQAIDRKKYKENTLSLLGRLMEVDVQRSMYYSDLKSRFSMEYLIEGISNDSKEFQASGFKLTSLYHIEHLMAIQYVDLSDNSLCSRSLPLLCYLQFCKVLKLDRNKIENLKGFPHLPFLESLSLSNNELSNIDGLDEIIENSKNLVTLELNNNPISSRLSDTVNEICGLRKLKNLKVIT